MWHLMLIGSWIKSTKVVVGARRIRSEKLRKHQYRERCARSPEGKGVEWDGDNMWEQVKRIMLEIAREVYGSVRVGERTQIVCAGTTR